MVNRLSFQYLLLFFVFPIGRKMVVVCFAWDGFLALMAFRFSGFSLVVGTI